MNPAIVTKWFPCLKYYTFKFKFDMHLRFSEYFTYPLDRTSWHFF